ncbi:uncharacterized protein LOC106150398 [Lingula anatina]|uniref:Uncharacterized protein LOC106150398 n=1 Tax=Lingula anatina TaxID=7574 RepID=A0A1S3GZF6_LINAN|nr:uncharacterized protein LOC106150398 [Lingula anatina]|eukprot:XP_013378611.1 uncharacterized protein LOC106150398 [Lingula anatina]
MDINELELELSEDLTQDDIESLKLLTKESLVLKTDDNDAKRFLTSLRECCTPLEKYYETLENLLSKLKKTVSFSCGEVYWSDRVKEHRIKYETWLKEKGIQGNPNFFGRKHYLEQLESGLYERSIKAICICGLGGLGKSALAREMCSRIAWKIKKVEIRAKDTIKEFLTTVVINLMTHSDQRKPMLTEADLTDSLLSILNTENEDTVVILDDVDKLMGSSNKDNFLNLMHDIVCRMNPDSKVKLLITSRVEMMVEGRFGGLMQEIELKSMEQREAEELLQKTVCMNSGQTCHVTLTDSQCSTLAHLCGCSPQALLVVADLMRQGDLQPDDIISRLQPGKLKATATLPPVHRCLQEMFIALPGDMQNCLVSLSVFDSSFDAEAAYFVFKELQPKESRSQYAEEDAKFDLRCLIGHHLVEFEDYSIYSNTVTMGYKKSSLGRYSLHPLVKNFAEGKAVEENFRNITVKGMNGFVLFFEQKAKEIHKQGLGVFSVVVQQVMSLYLRTYMKIAVNNPCTSEKMSTIMVINIFIENLSDLSERIKYLAEAQKKAEGTGDVITSCYRMLQTARCYLDLEQYDEAEAICKQASLLFQDDSVKHNFPIQTLYHYVCGNIFYKREVYEGAFHSFSECKRCLMNIKGEFDVSLDDVENFIGSVYFSLRQYKEAEKHFSIAHQRQKSKGNLTPVTCANIAKALKAMCRDKLYKNEHPDDNFKKLFERAETLNSDALDIATKNGDFSLNRAKLLRDFADLYQAKFEVLQSYEEENVPLVRIGEKSSACKRCLKDASKLLEEAVSIAKKRATPYHRFKFDCMVFRAFVLKELGEYEEGLCEGNSSQYFEEAARQVNDLSSLLSSTPHNEGLDPQEKSFLTLEEDVLPILKKLNRSMDLERIRKIIIDYKKKHGMEESESDRDTSDEDCGAPSPQECSSFSDSDGLSPANENVDSSSPPHKLFKWSPDNSEETKKRNEIVSPANH